jgi:hypothetical protein
MPPLTSAPGADSRGGEVALLASDIASPQCDSGIGTVMTTLARPHLLDGVRIEPLGVWPDDSGHFIDVQRTGCSPGAHFPPASTQVSATVTYPGIGKAFHDHLRQDDSWTVANLIPPGVAHGVPFDDDWETPFR